MKKVLALVLAVVLVLGMSTVAFAKAPTKTELKLNAAGKILSLDVGYSSSKYGTISNATAKADGKIEIPISSVLQPIGGGTLTKSMASSDNWGVGYKVIKGANTVINKVELDGLNVKLSFQKFFVFTKDTDWEVEIWLTQDRSKQDDTLVNIAGTVVVAADEIDADDSYFYTGDGSTVKATEYIKKIELDLGHDVSIITKLFEGKKYYGVANEDVVDADTVIFDKYASVENVYNLKTIGLNAAGNIVKFNMDDSLYVYTLNDAGDDLVYLGRSKDMLPYYTKYYVSSKELDVADDVDVDTDTAPTDGAGTDNAPSGGDDVVANEYDNPGTGR